MPTKRTPWPILTSRWIERYFWWIQSVLILLLLVLLVLLRQALRPPFDLIISGGRVFDGRSFLLVPQDIGIRDGKIATVGFLFGTGAKKRLDARSRVVSPGFIDTHVHVEASLAVGRPFRAPNFIKMGVTTVVTGNCGTSHRRLPQMLDSLDRTGGQVNVATLVGHNTIRELAGGPQAGPASPAQIAAMRDQIRDAMRAGALGLSTGLEYSPGVSAPKSELLSLAEAVADEDGLYATHLRDEGSELMTGIAEAVEICRMAQIPLHLSHLKLAARRKWGGMVEVMQQLDIDRTTLKALTFDVYAYTRSSSSLDLLLPIAFRGTLATSRTILSDPTRRRALVAGLLDELKATGFTDYQFASIAWFRDEAFWGKTLPTIEISAAWRKDTAWVDDLVREPKLRRSIQNLLYVYTHGGAQMIYSVMDETDMLVALGDRHATIGSDSGVWTAERRTAHPRSIGNFPKVIGDLVRRRKLSLASALRKMTSEPAKVFGLANRGVIQVGAAADLVIFNPETVSGPADYNRLAEPRGIDHVIVNGVVVASAGGVLNQYPGRVLRKSSAQVRKDGL